MTRTIVLAAAALSMMATGASAAHLGEQQGTVLINNWPAAANIELAPGDRITVMSGRARVVYDNGATVVIGEGQTAVVLANAPEGSPPHSGGYKDPEPGPYSSEDDTNIGLVVGGVAVVGAALAITLSHQGGTPNPLSP